MLAGWPTATSEDHKSDGPKSAERLNCGTPLQSDLRLRNIANLAGWPTARATDAEKNVRTPEGAQREMERKGGPQDLMQAALLTAWGTPAARDWKSGEASQETLGRSQGQKEIHGTAHGCACLVNEARLTAFGDQPIGYLLGPGGWEIVPASGQVERGSFPLVDGTPARVGRLRGYGDGIVAQVAQAFIEAYLSVIGERPFNP
jgi:hypothetical protein